MFQSTPSANSPVVTYGVDYERRDIDISKEIMRLVPDANPFLVILAQSRKEETDTAEFKWYDSEPGGWWTKAEDDYLSSDTEIVVDDATIFRHKDIVKVPRTGEVMFVMAMDENNNKITVVRGYGVTAAVDIQEGDWLLRLGNAMEENSRAPDPKITQLIKNYNFTQIFRRPFDQSMTSDAEKLKTSETERARLRRDQLLEHRLDIERALLFGERKEDVANRRRMTGGLMSFIQTNYYDAQGTLTEDKFEEFCETAFRFGSGNKLFVCSYRVGSIINKFARDRIETRSGESTYGVRLSTYKSYHGDLAIVPSRALEKEYRGLGFLLDIDYVRYRPLRGRDSSLRTNIQPNDQDGWKDEYLTEAGLQVRMEKTHAILTNAA